MKCTAYWAYYDIPRLFIFWITYYFWWLSRILKKSNKSKNIWFNRKNPIYVFEKIIIFPNPGWQVGQAPWCPWWAPWCPRSPWALASRRTTCNRSRRCSRTQTWRSWDPCWRRTWATRTRPSTTYSPCSRHDHPDMLASVTTLCVYNIYSRATFSWLIYIFLFEILYKFTVCFLLVHRHLTFQFWVLPSIKLKNIPASTKICNVCCRSNYRYLTAVSV